MNPPRIARKADYTVTPIQTTGTFQLTVTIDRNPPITLQNTDFLLLARLGSIITYNLMLYPKALQLCQSVQQGKIPQGHLPNTILYPRLAYRVMFGYRNHKGTVCNHYATAGEAYNSPIIQKEIAEAASAYGQHHDYAKCIATVEQGLPYTILHYTLMHSRIATSGNIRGYPVPKTPNTSQTSPNSH